MFLVEVVLCLLLYVFKSSEDGSCCMYCFWMERVVVLLKIVDGFLVVFEKVGWLDLCKRIIINVLSM